VVADGAAGVEAGAVVVVRVVVVESSRTQAATLSTPRFDLALVASVLWVLFITVLQWCSYSHREIWFGLTQLIAMRLQ
jgi:hypothetical protein